MVALAGNGSATASGTASASATVAPYKGAAAAVTAGGSVAVVAVAALVGAIVLKTYYATGNSKESKVIQDLIIAE